MFVYTAPVYIPKIHKAETTSTPSSTTCQRREILSEERKRLHRVKKKEEIQFTREF